MLIKAVGGRGDGIESGYLIRFIDWVKGCNTDDSYFESRQRQEGVFLFQGARKGSRIYQAPCSLLPGAFSLGVKRQGRESDHSSSSKL